MCCLWMWFSHWLNRCCSHWIRTSGSSLFYRWVWDTSTVSQGIRSSHNSTKQSEKLLWAMLWGLKQIYIIEGLVVTPKTRAEEAHQIIPAFLAEGQLHLSQQCVGRCWPPPETGLRACWTSGLQFSVAMLTFPTLSSTCHKSIQICGEYVVFLKRNPRWRVPLLPFCQPPSQQRSSEMVEVPR